MAAGTDAETATQSGAQTRADASKAKVFDGRPYQHEGREPFAHIMRAVESLLPGQALRLINTFDPKPLEAVLSSRGFRYEVTEIGPEHWEVLFEPDPAVRSEDPFTLHVENESFSDAVMQALRVAKRLPSQKALVIHFGADPAHFAESLEKQGFITKPLPEKGPFVLRVERARTSQAVVQSPADGKA